MARILFVCMLLWSIPAAALELPAVAPTLAQDLVSGLRAAGSTATTVLVQPFVGPAETAGNLDQRLKDALHTQLGLTVLSSAGQPTSDANRLMAAAAKMGAQAAVMGSLTCDATTCTATGEAYDVATRQLSIVITVQFDARGSDRHHGSATAAAAANLRDLAGRLSADLQQVSSQFGYRRFAFAPCSETGNGANKDGAYGRALADELSGLLQRDYRLSMVPANEVAGSFAGTHNLSAGQTMSVMAQLGAQAFMMGSIDSQEGTSQIALQVVGTSNGEMLAHEEGAMSTLDLQKLSAQGDGVPDAIGAFKRSLLLPGWGQYYSDEPLKGTLFAVGEAAFIGALVAFQLAGMDAENHYVGITDPSQQATIDHYYGVAKSDYNWRNLFIGLAVGTHVANALDALLWRPAPDDNL